MCTLAHSLSHSPAFSPTQTHWHNVRACTHFVCHAQGDFQKQRALQMVYVPVPEVAIPNCTFGTRAQQGCRGCTSQTAVFGILIW